MPDGGKLTVRTANVTAAECAQATPTRACRPPTTCWSRSPTPAPASRRRSSTRFSSRSSRPRRSARAPGSASRPSTASSSRPAASSIRTRSSARARCSASSCRAMCRARRRRPTRCRKREAPGIADTIIPLGATRRHAATADLTGQGTILLVEDEEGLRALNARGLKSRGYSVLEAGNGVEAIEVFERARRQGRSRGVGRGDAGDGRPDAAQGAAQAQSRTQDHLRLRLRRGGVREEPAAPARSSRSCPSRSRSSS